jgi:hypothetical protein
MIKMLPGEKRVKALHLNYVNVSISSLIESPLRLHFKSMIHPLEFMVGMVGFHYSLIYFFMLGLLVTR